VAKTAAAPKTAAASRTRAAAARTAGASRPRAAAPKSRAELYEIAKQRDLPGRSTMSRDELAKALGEK
jgi:DNA end-binding protein Ku